MCIRDSTCTALIGAHTHPPALTGTLAGSHQRSLTQHSPALTGIYRHSPALPGTNRRSPTLTNTR
eukprot:7352793-Alexandrium_andersonii.AAC.1